MGFRTRARYGWLLSGETGPRRIMSLKVRVTIIASDNEINEQTLVNPQSFQNVLGVNRPEAGE